MFRHYTTLAIRHLVLHRTPASIHVGAMALAIAAATLLFGLVHFEMSFDRFHKDADHIFRIQNDYVRRGELIYDSAETMSAIGPNLRVDFPEITETLRMYHWGAKWRTTLQNIGDQGATPGLAVPNLIAAEANFFEFWSFQLLEGDAAGALAQPGNMVLSRTLAKKLFPAESAMGKTLALHDEGGTTLKLEVKGVFEDIPINSHFQADALVSYPSLYQISAKATESFRNNWNINLVLTYLKLTDPGLAEQLTKKLPAWLDANKPEMSKLDETGQRIRTQTLSLTALPDIHFNPKPMGEPSTPGNILHLRFLFAVAVLILFMAWINTTIWSISRSMQRHREVGIRKVAGASASQLTTQFVYESLMLNLIALPLGLCLAELAFPWFSRLTDRPLSLQSPGNAAFWLPFLAFYLLGSLLAGLYPAWRLSRLPPINNIQARRQRKPSFLAGKALVWLQLTLTFGLVAGTCSIYRQMDYLSRQNLGFDSDSVWVIPSPCILPPEKQAKDAAANRFIQELERRPAVIAAGRASSIPGEPFTRGLFVSTNKQDEKGHSFNLIYADQGFFKVYGMQFNAGNSFEQLGSGQLPQVVLTEGAAQEMGFLPPADAIGHHIYLYGQAEHEVIGVLADYHQESLHKNKVCTQFYYREGMLPFFVIKLAQGATQANLDDLEHVYNTHFPGNPFQIFPAEGHFERQYKLERMFSGLFGAFSLLALAIGLIGLSGMTAFEIGHRKGEIAIRKAMGANASSIVWLLLGNYLWLALLAGTIGLPISAYWVLRWLASFKEQINLDLWFYLTPTVLVMAACSISVAIHAWQLAGQRPAKIMGHLT